MIPYLLLPNTRNRKPLQAPEADDWKRWASAQANGLSAGFRRMPDSGIGHAVDILRLPQADGKETPAATSRPARYTQPPAGTVHRDGAENALLKHSEEEEKALERMREEMETLTARYRTLRENMLESSPVYKKLHQLAKQKKPQNTRTLIGEELWEQIKQQAQKVYPGLRRYVINRCPDLNESEWAYCCLYLFGFDTNDEALLLGINTSSVRTKTLRLRSRLNIDLPAQMSLYEYITMQI